MSNAKGGSGWEVTNLQDWDSFEDKPAYLLDEWIANRRSSANPGQTPANASGTLIGADPQGDDRFYVLSINAVDASGKTITTDGQEVADPPVNVRYVPAIFRVDELTARPDLDQSTPDEWNVREDNAK